MRDLMLGAENESARFKAAEYIINEAAGRNDKVGFGETFVKGIAVAMLNDRFARAREAVRLSLSEGESIPVESLVSS